MTDRELEDLFATTAAAGVLVSRADADRLQEQARTITALEAEIVRLRRELASSQAALRCAMRIAENGGV